MKKVLFSIVGFRDPIPQDDKGEGEGAIVTLAREVKPDEAVLYATYNPQEEESSILENLSHTAEWLKSEELVPEKGVIEEKIKLLDPRNYETLLPKLRDRVEEYFEFASEEINSYINLASGTPQQETALILLSENGYFMNPNLYQVAEPRYAEEGEGRCKMVNPAFLREENLLRAASHHLSNFDFKTAAIHLKQVKNITLYSSRKTLSDFYSELCKSCTKWDHLKYREAFDKLSKISREYERINKLEGVMPLIKRQKDLLQELSKEVESENKENMTDLYHNAKRAYERGRFTETLSRFWRLAEGALFYRLRQGYQIEPTELSESNSRDNLDKIYDYFGRRQRYLTFSNGRKVLSEVFDDKKLGKFESAKINIPYGSSPDDATYSEAKAGEVFGDLRRKRNDSISAHGMKPVSWDGALSSLKIANKLLEIFELKLTSADDYPFSCGVIEKISEHVKQI